jgi:hypothetical protein
MKKLALICTLLLAACTTPAPKPVLLKLPPLAIGTSLFFPYGHYRHHVKLNIPHGAEGQAQNFSFDGVAETSEEKIQLIVLSPLYTTMMEIVEDRHTGEVSIATFEPRLRHYQSNFAQYYALLRQIVCLEKRAVHDDSVRLTLTHGTREAAITLSEVRGEIPRHIAVEDPAFNLQIEVEPLDEEHP